MTTPLDMYSLCRNRLLKLADTLDEPHHATPVPALPLWTVRDTYAHLVGNVTDRLSGNLDGLGTAPWTAEQIAKRAGHSLADICAEWTRYTERFDSILRGDDSTAGNAFDLWHHEQDVRAALGETVDRDETSVRFILDFMTPAVSKAWPSGTPAVRLVADDLDGEWRLGTGTPETTIHAPAYELARAIAGRRSRAQVRALGWPDPAPHIANMSAFEFADRDLVE